MQTYPQIFFDSKKARDFSGFHPWVRAHSLIEPTAPLDAGQIVELMSPGGGWVGRGVYNPSSHIRVRLYQWDRAEQLDIGWCFGRLQRAIELRETWAERHHALDAVRLVNSEGDGLSGLIVDRFANYLVIQITALAMQRWQEPIVEWLAERLQPAGIFVQIDTKTAKHEGIEPRDDLVWGTSPTGPIECIDHGVRVQFDLVSGQKTGYYLDQRANRRRAAEWMAAGEVLDVCCYLGGFSLAASLTGRPTSVLAVDSSSVALEQAATNARLNGFSNIEFIKADCFDYLDQLVQENRKFQTVVLDPPRMASTRGQVSAALRAYHRLNLSAVNLLVPGGVLITCSCSGRVDRSDLTGVLASVSKRTRRSIQIVESLGADFDHPIDVNCPESEYLKCLICRVG
ncbi:MAG: class I SAM-dependent rRNA methyltransferase [Pirellulaceae bacterium]